MLAAATCPRVSACALFIAFPLPADAWLAICCMCYGYCMREMGRMVSSVLQEDVSPDARKGLLFIYWSTVVVWLAFPVSWFAQNFGLWPLYYCELNVLWANFVSKVRGEAITLVCVCLRHRPCVTACASARLALPAISAYAWSHLILPCSCHFQYAELPHICRAACKDADLADAVLPATPKPC